MGEIRENYENLRSHRQAVKTRMNELAQIEEATNRIDDWVGDIDSQSQQRLKDRLGLMRDTFKSENGFTARKDLTNEHLLVKVVTASVITILKKEIRTRQKKAEEARFSRRLYR